MTVALTAGAFFCAQIWHPAAAEPKPACDVPGDLTKLDRPLVRTAVKLSAREPIKIVAIGSSSTAGAGASSPAASYPMRLAAYLQQRFPDESFTVVNRGVNGDMAAQMLARFDTDILAEKPDLALWQVGSNSVLRDHPILPAGALIRDGVQRLKAAGIDVVLVNLQYAPKILVKRDAQGMVDVIEATAKDVNVSVFHRFSVMRYWRETRGLPFDTFVTPDGVHMNDWGYDCWAKLLSTALIDATLRATAAATAAAAPVVPASIKPAR